MQLKNVLRQLLSKEAREKIERMMTHHFESSNPLADEHVDRELQVMLDTLAANEWADWAWEEDNVKPSLQKLAEFAYKHKHMVGVQSAKEIDAGRFDAPQHFKVMLMYQEFFLQFLQEHAADIAKLQSRIEFCEHCDAPFLQHPPVAQAVGLQEKRAKQQEEALRAQIQNVLTLRKDQKEAVGKCLASNHIINMPTGSSKTLISVKSSTTSSKCAPTKRGVRCANLRARASAGHIPEDSQRCCMLHCC